jgi:hypothetical protein
MAALGSKGELLVESKNRPLLPSIADMQRLLGMSVRCRFCCKSRLRLAVNRDSVVLTRISARSIHDGPSEE